MEGESCEEVSEEYFIWFLSWSGCLPLEVASIISTFVPQESGMVADA
jgi:hypothetical protein